MNVFVSSRPVTLTPFRTRSTLVQHQCIAQASKVESFIVSSVLAGTLLWGSPAHAEIIQTVSPSEVSEMGAPLKEQKVEKKKVWLVFIIGASTLFAFTNLIENNSSWFPAVKRANEAMSNRRKQQMQEEQETRLMQSVEDGLQDARQTSSSNKEVVPSRDVSSNEVSSKEVPSEEVLEEQNSSFTN